MAFLVKITDPEHELHGEVLPGGCIYYDIHHTGSSPDLYQVERNGETYRVLSTQIDEEHYKAQLLADKTARLGAKVGDIVFITKAGSGSFCHGWDDKAPHEITKITPGGQVEFDGGGRVGASMFRPEARLAS